MMRVSLDYFALSMCGLSAVFLGSAQFAQSGAAGDGGPVYPIRFALPAASAVNGVLPGLAMAADVDGALLDTIPAEGPATPETAPARGSAELSPTAANMGPPGQRSATENVMAFDKVMAVEYDIASARGSSAEVTVQSAKALGGTIDVRKRVRVGKGTAKAIDVKVGSGANIYVNGAQLAAMLEAQGRSAKALSKAGSDGFVSLDELRGKGMQVGYDAAGDALVIDGEV